MTYTSVHAQTVSPTNIPAPTLQPVSTQSPTGAPVATPTMPTIKSGEVCNNPRGCFVEVPTATPPAVAAGSFMEIGQANNNKNKSGSNTSQNGGVNNHANPTISHIVPSIPAKTYQPIQKKITLSPTNFPTPTLFVAPPAIHSAKPQVTISNEPSFFETILTWLSHFFENKHHSRHS